MSHNPDLELISTDNQNQHKNQEFIQLKVIGNDNEILFRVKMITPMYKLKKMYCERVGIPISSLRFLYEGNCVNDSESPITLEMSNKHINIIEVYEKQTGG